MTRRLTGRTVIVTGGGSGIGKGACLRLAEEGANVVVADIRAPLAEQVAGQIASAGGSALAIECNVSREADVALMVTRSVAEFGGLWGMVANAGTAGRGWIHETTLEDWQFVLGVNLTGPFLCAKYALPVMMQAGGGSFVVTSSIAGSVVGAGGAAASYTVSKHGVIGLAKQIAVDYGSYGIRANAIQPGGVTDSKLAVHARQDREHATTPQATLPRGKPWLALPRQGKSKDEYGATIAFLMSDDAGFITGTSIPVDGGYLAS